MRKPGAGEQTTSLRRLCRGQFGLYLAGNGLSLVGTWMQRIACRWLVWEWTHSAFWLGVLSAADLLSVFLIDPFAGVAADRWDRLRQNRLVQSASVVIAALLFLMAWDLPVWCSRSLHRGFWQRQIPAVTPHVRR